MESGFLYLLIGVLASLLCTYISFRYYLYYRSLIYSRGVNQEKNRRLLMRAQFFMLASSLVFIGSLVYLFNLSRTDKPPPAISTLSPGEGLESSTSGANQLTATPATNLLITSIPSPEASATPGVGFARIGNTNGFGANVRSEPGLNFESLIQLSDGSRVELTGEAQSADGFNWQRVRLEDGRLGWIADKFLIPEQ